jgi:hypothetical protein
MTKLSDVNRENQKVYGDKRTVEGNTVALLHIFFENRGLKLLENKSRALKKNEIHELMITDENAMPGGNANRVRVISFFEVTKSGLIVENDEVWIENKFLGKLAGYDITHMPNHMNILVKTENLDEPDQRVGDLIRFIKSSPKPDST